LNTAIRTDSKLSIIERSREINEKMPDYVINLTLDGFKKCKKSIKDSNILILGISYKPDVKDIQLTPAKHIIKKLKSLGVNISIYDPYFSSTKIFDIDVSNSISDELLKKMDAAIIVTAHEEFFKFEISNFSKMKTPILIDTRGIIDPNDAHKSKLIFRGLGRGK
jgi:UDP-N-acetyl-D-mannosaminuronate dehydrogenase